MAGEPRQLDLSQGKITGNLETPAVPDQFQRTAGKETGKPLPYQFRRIKHQGFKFRGGYLFQGSYSQGNQIAPALLRTKTQSKIRGYLKETVHLRVTGFPPPGPVGVQGETAAITIFQFGVYLVKQVFQGPGKRL
jgi:hypothetical protein